MTVLAQVALLLWSYAPLVAAFAVGQFWERLANGDLHRLAVLGPVLAIVVLFAAKRLV